MKNETYEEFVDKFKPKKTTDDCYTPQIVYNAVSDWVTNEYNLNAECFIRPFFPGGDYKKVEYKNTDIVVDNPPFSILAEIVKFYTEKNIKFFLFAPTLVGLIRYSDLCTAIACGVSITYENGAAVNTSFVTNLENENIRIKTSPTLYETVKNANDKQLAENKKQLPKYHYPFGIVTASNFYPYSRYGIELSIPRNESIRISRLDAQIPIKKTIFGCGLIVSERLATEREKAEREKAERFEFSEREKKIIKSLSCKE